MQSVDNGNIIIPKGHKLCPVCGKVKRLGAFSQAGEYCDRCRERMLWTPLPWQYILAVVLIIMLAFFSVFFLIKSAPIAMYVMNASDSYEKGSLNDAIDSIENAEKTADGLNESTFGKFYYSIGNKAVLLKTEICSKAYSSFRAGAEVSNYFSEAQLEKAEYSGMKKYFEYYNEYEKVSKKVQEILGEYSENDDIPYEYIMDKISALSSETKGDEGKGFIEYFKAELMSYSMGEKGSEYTFDEVLSQIKKAQKLLPNEKVLFAQIYTQCYKQSGDYSSMVKTCDSLIEINNNDTEAYHNKVYALCMQDKYSEAMTVCSEMSEFNEDASALYAAEALIYRMNGEYSAAKKACVTGENLNGEAAELICSNFSEDTTRRQANWVYEYTKLMYEKAVCCLLTEDFEGAFEASYTTGMDYIYTYYSFCSDRDITELSQKLCAVSAISASKKGDSETLAEIKESVKLSDSVEKCISGEKTLEELFVKGKESGLLA